MRSGILISALLIFCLALSSNIGCHAKHLWVGRVPGWARTISPYKMNLPETQLLLQNDNLFPGQSRTQAMSLEAETGHLTPAEDAVLIPMLRKRNRHR